MRWFIVATCLVTLFLLSSCGCGGGSGGVAPLVDNNPPSPPYNIYGVVTDSAGKVLSDADVSTYYKDDPNTILDEDKTDAQGKYYLWVPVAKDRIYVVTASKTGYKKDSKEINLLPPDYQQEVDFALELVGKK